MRKYLLVQFRDSNSITCVCWSLSLLLPSNVRTAWPNNVSGVISPLFSISYWAPADLWGSSFRVIFLPFHTVHGVLKARTLKWFYFLAWVLMNVNQSHFQPSLVELHRSCSPDSLLQASEIRELFNVTEAVN